MRRRHSSSRRPKKPVAWFASNQTYIDNATDLTLRTSSPTPNFEILAQHQRAAVASPELVSEIQRHTIETVRGEILVYGEMATDIAPDFKANTLCLYHAGIRVVELLPDGTPPVYSPSTSNEADDDWMWLCHRIVAPFIPTNAQAPEVLEPAGVGYPLTPPVEVHIKSKRKLLDNEALVIYEQASVTFPNEEPTAIHVHKYLRTLVSRPA